MLKHVVMWRLKESAEGRTKAENAVYVKEILDLLPYRIKEIKSLEVGINMLNTPPSYDLVLIVDFANMLDLQAYQANPEHVKVADYILKVRETRAVVDYEY
ncbi:MAG: Dabb family protein [Methanomassiliicoccales archaeon]|jgi:hypothetical protein